MSHPRGSDPKSDPKLAARNKRLAVICGVVFVGMVGMAFAAVPFYRAFCQATGFAGSTRRLVARSRDHAPSPYASGICPWSTTSRKFT